MRYRPLKLLSVVHYHQSPKTQPSPHAIGKGIAVVELVTKGRGWAFHNDEWREVLPGSLLWQLPGDQTIGRSDPEDPYSCLAVWFTFSKETSHRVPRFSIWHDVGEAVDLTERAIGHFLDESFDRDALMGYLFARLYFCAVVYHHERERQGISEPLRIARSLIDTRYADPIKVVDLAKAAGWSVAHLHDQFRLAYGSTPRQEILNRRLKASKELLVGSGLSIKEIAGKTGFTHSSAFCSSFRARFGLTPKAYRDAYFFGTGMRIG